MLLCFAASSLIVYAHLWRVDKTGLTHFMHTLTHFEMDGQYTREADVKKGKGC